MGKVIIYSRTFLSYPYYDDDADHTYIGKFHIEINSQTIFKARIIS